MKIKLSKICCTARTPELLETNAVHNSTVQNMTRFSTPHTQTNIVVEVIVPSKPKQTVSRRMDTNYTDGILDNSFTNQRTSTKLIEQTDDMIDLS